jgi:Putative Ig domain
MAASIQKHILPTLIVALLLLGSAARATAQITLACPASTGQVGTAYSSALVATGAPGPYAFIITAGSLPTGLSLNSTTGAITGTPTTTGSFGFTAMVVDSLGTPASNTTCSITVAPTGKLEFLPPFLQFTSDLTTLPVIAVNVSRYSVQFNNVTVSGPPFSIKNNYCTDTLAPLHVCSVVIQFTPTQVGNFSGQLTFTDTAAGSPQSIPLYGTAFQKKGY